MSVSSFYRATCLSLLLFPFFSSASEVCVKNIYITNHYPARDFNLKPGEEMVGSWVAAGGGAKEVTQVGYKDLSLQDSYVTMIVRKAAVSSPDKCIADVALLHSYPHQAAYPDQDHILAGEWDIPDDFGSKDSRGGGGGGKMSLYYKLVKDGSYGDTKVVSDVALLNKEYADNKYYDPTRLEKDYISVGWWGNARNNYGHMFYGYASKQGVRFSFAKSVEYFVKKNNVHVGGQVEGIQGEWKLINSCRGEKKCNDHSLKYTVGIEKTVGVELSDSYKQSVELAVSASFDKFGAEIGFEGRMGASSEIQSTIVSSFTENVSVTRDHSCKTASELWQWNTYVDFNDGKGLKKIKSKSGILACASAGKGPKGSDLKNIEWSPEN